MAPIISRPAFISAATTVMATSARPSTTPVRKRQTIASRRSTSTPTPEPPTSPSSSATAPTQPLPSSSKSPPARKPRKRSRVSNLTRKYRPPSSVDDWSDESLLIGDTSSPPTILRSTTTATPNPPFNQQTPIAAKVATAVNPLSTTLTSLPPTTPANPVVLKNSSTGETLRSLLLNTATATPSANNAQTSREDDIPLTEQARIALRDAARATSSSRLMSSRFPHAFPDAISQLCDALTCALSHGFDRLRVDFSAPHTLLNAPLQMSKRAADADSEPKPESSASQEKQRISLLSHTAACIITHLSCVVRSEGGGVITDSRSPSPSSTAEKTTDAKGRSGARTTSPGREQAGAAFGIHTSGATKPLRRNFDPRGCLVLFTDADDMATGQVALDAALGDLEPRPTVGLVGAMDAAHYVGKLVIIVAPTNRRGNPVLIEGVERVHYSNFNRNNWVIMLDPDMVALTCFASLTGEPREPLFLSDYVMAYHINPVAFAASEGTGAVLRCFPRKWELYLSRGMAEDDGAFRLVAEQKTKPSREKVYCEFGWRVEKEHPLGVGV